MPENDNEIILLGDSDDAYFTDEMEDMIGKDLYIERYDPGRHAETDKPDESCRRCGGS